MSKEINDGVHLSVKRYDIDVYSSFEAANWTLVESEVGDFVYANEHEISIAELQQELAESERHRQILIQQNAELLTQVSKDKETISHTPEGEKLKTNTLKTKNVTIRTGKHLFYCTCGCNVFHKPDNENANLYKCNSCDTQYYGESE